MGYLMKDLTPKGARRRAVRGEPQPPAHLWDGEDTACRMWSTGGISRHTSYRVSDTPEGRPICGVCEEKTRAGSAPAEPFDVLGWCRDLVHGVGGFRDYEEYEKAVFEDRDVSLVSFVVHALANPRCAGSETMLRAIRERRERNTLLELLQEQASEVREDDGGEEW